MPVVTFLDDSGRVCRVPWPPEDLTQVEILYHDCSCTCAGCAKEEAMSYIKPDDVVIFAEPGMKVEVTGRELSWKAAADEVHRMARRYMQDRPGTDYRTAMWRVLDTHPQLKKTYSGHWG